MIDKTKLAEIINGFARDNKIFSKEAQFQFDLAWEIRNQFPNYEVVLEYLFKEKKWYIDIVAFSAQEKKCVPIELKYKTTDKNIVYKIGDESYYTFNQGACDNGSYDYIKDISRIENLGNSLEYKGQKYDIEGGYAIILTNDWHYYESLPEKRKNEKYKQFYWKNFSLAQDSISGDICWIDPYSPNDEIEDPGKHTTIDRSEKIHLSQSYRLKENWANYEIKEYEYEPSMKKAPDFKHLITYICKNKGLEAMKEASRIASENGIADMTLDEINAEINVTRE